MSKTMKNYSNILAEAKKIVFNKLRNEPTGHDYWHSHRVARNAVLIAKKEKADVEIVELAAWLHDVGGPGKNHEIKGAKLVKKLLTQLGVKKQGVTRVVSCVKNHRFSTGKPESLEEKIIQDADKLDALGAIGIARIFALGGRQKKIIHDPNIKTGSSINHFYDKLLKLKRLMHTKTAKDLAVKRDRLMRSFLRSFYLEWKGKQ